MFIDNKGDDDDDDDDQFLAPIPPVPIDFQAACGGQSFL
jgi:hypothetical protein